MKLVRFTRRSAADVDAPADHSMIREEELTPSNMAVKRAVQVDRLHPLLQRGDDEQSTYDSPWAGQHLPYTIVGTLLAAVALAAVLAYVIIKRRRKASSPLTPEPPKQQATMRCPSFTIRLTPSLQQPISVLEITRTTGGGNGGGSGGSQTQSTSTTTTVAATTGIGGHTPRPLLIDTGSSSVSSIGGGGFVLGPIPGGVGSILSQPIRIKAKGLLERRGSNASLTIDLNPVETLHLATPPKECSAVEYLTSAGNRLTRRQLRMCLKDTKALHQEFLDIPLNHPGKLDLPGCSNKNRYKSIWPNEHSRVKLPKLRKHSSSTTTTAKLSPVGSSWSSGQLQKQQSGASYSPSDTAAGFDASSQQQGPIEKSVSPTTASSAESTVLPESPPAAMAGAAAAATTGTTEFDNDEDPSSTYINANYIRGYDNESKTYVAAQGPMVNTIDDFWLMVWHERSPCIVMMTRLKENNRVKCEPYLPTREAQYGDLYVTVRMTTAKNGYYVRDILLRRDNELRQIKHYWFTGWPDHKAPSSTAKQLIELAQEVEAERQRQMRKRSPNGQGQGGVSANLTGPVVVHCSAGLGRTGCFIATSVGMKQLQEENMVDVLGVVCQLRLDRGGMIQTVEQYEFIHYALMQYERQLPETPTSAPMPLTSSGSHSNSNPSSRSSSKHDSPVF